MKENNQDKSFIGPKENISTNVNQPQNNAFMQNLPALSRSYNSAREEQGFNWSQFGTVVKRRLGIITLVTLAVTAGVGHWSYNKEPIYHGKFSLLVESPQEQQTSDEEGIQGNVGTPTVDYGTEIELLSSPSVLIPMIQDLAQTYPEVELEDFEKLEIKQLDNTQILEVSFEDKDPEKIKIILDKLSQTYLDQNKQEQNSNIQEGIKYIDNQLSNFQGKVNSLQGELQRFRQKYGVIDPTKQASNLSNQLIDIEKNYIQAQIELKQATSAYDIIQKQLNLSPKQAIAVSYLTESPRYQNLLKELQDVEVELAVQSATYTDESPQIQTIKEKRDNVLVLLRQETKALLQDQFEDVTDEDSILLSAPNKIRADLTKQMITKANEIKVLESKNQSLKKVLDDLNKRMKQMPYVARKYTDLQRELNYATGSLTRFLEAREKLQLQKAQKTLTWKLIAPPKNPKASSESTLIRDLAFGFLGGIALGLIVALLAEKSDRLIYSVKELEELVKSPIVGYIPIQPKTNSMEDVLHKAFSQLNNKKNSRRPSWFKSKSSPQEYTSSYWLESFRNLYTNIRLLGSNTSVNSLVISSPSLSDGKSLISLHFAQAAAAMGQRVLLIDANLRFPKLHQHLELPYHEGLSNYLASVCSLEDAIQKLPQWDNLSFIAAGDTPPDPTRLLSSRKMTELNETLHQSNQYDLIIYNSPPVLGFADAKIITSFTNGIIMVVKMRKTERMDTKNAIEQLRISNVPILGVVANGVDRSDQESYSNYGQYNKYYHGQGTNSHVSKTEKSSVKNEQSINN